MSEAGSLARIELLVSLGRHAEALSALAPVLAAEPDNSYAWCLMSQAQLQLDRPEEASRSAEAAIRADPSAEWPLRLLSIALRETGDGVRAAELAMASVRLEPNLWEPRAILAIALSEVAEASADGSEVRDSRHRALRVAETAVSIAPNEPQTHFVAGLVADRLGRRGDAENAYRRALRLNPQHAAARNNLAVILSRRGDFIGAAKGFTEAAAGDSHLGIAGRNVDHVVIRMVQRAHLVVLATAFAAIAGPRLLQADTHLVPLLASLIGIGVVTASVVRFRSATPRRLHRYLLTLPARDRLLTAWITLLVVALLLLCVASALSRDARTWAFVLALAAVVLASVLSYLHATRGTSRTRRRRSRS